MAALPTTDSDAAAVAHARVRTRLDAALQAARQEFAAANPKSRAQHQLASGVLPGGTTRSTLFNSPFPLTLQGGSGATVTSLDGRCYTDFLNEYTAGLYGHSHPVLRRAAEEALDHGWVIGGHIRAEQTMAQLLCDRFPSLERVRFANSGTEANLYAISAARAVTGRSKIVVFDGAYHGGVFMFSHGVRSAVLAPFDFVVAPYNDLAGTLALLAPHAEAIAAVLVEPMQGAGGCLPGDPDFLNGLRAWTRQHGAWLIFDEVMTSRLAPGGLQSTLGITPDLTTLGKYLGGGFTFGAFGGRADLMEHFNPLRPGGGLVHSGTFNNNVFSMLVGARGLQEVFTPAAALALNARGDALRERLNQAVEESLLPMHFSGVGSMLCFHTCATPQRNAGLLKAQLDSNDAQWRELYFHCMLQHGLWLAGRGMVSLSLMITDADCDQLVGAVAAFVAQSNLLVSSASAGRRVHA